MSKTCFIYALCEPGTRTVRYIGKTVNLEKRIRQHRRDSPKKRNHLGNWLRKLFAVGQFPNLVVLWEVQEAESSAAEIKYIRIARKSLGMDLVNATDGGEGARGYVHTPESRKKIRDVQTGVPKSPACRAAIRAANSGENHPMFGKSPSLETRAKQSAGNSGENHPMFGSPRSSETRQRIVIAWTPEKRAKQSLRAKAQRARERESK